MNPTSSLAPVVSADPAPSHEEIEPRARELWASSGHPVGRDEAIWLEAERRLVAARRASPPPLPLSRLRSRWRLLGRFAPGYRLTWTR